MKNNQSFDSSRLEGKTILIVDDDPRNIFALVSYLEIIGLNVLTAESAAEAMELLTAAPSHQIELVLMDMMMPEMDGYQAIRLIQSTPTIAKLPVIAVTAQAMKGDREKCLAAGAIDYVSKPIDTNDLLEKMAAACEVYNQFKQ
jgi:CheY-like chemotaxis protein